MDDRTPARARAGTRARLCVEDPAPEIRAPGRHAAPVILKWGCRLLACLFLCTGLPAAADILNAGGTGSSGPLLNILFDDFAKKQPGYTLRTISPPLGSMGATRALLAGRIDLAIVGREPPQDELRKLGPSFLLGHTPFVMVTNDASAGSGLSIDELAKIYRGEIVAWKSGTPIRLVLRASFDTDSMLLKSMSSAMATAVDAAAKRAGMVTATDDIETLDLLNRVKGSLGPITLGHLRTTGSSLHVLALDGIAPAPAGKLNERYPWRKSLYVLLPPKPGARAQEFAAYLRSSAAVAVLNRYGYVRDATP